MDLITASRLKDARACLRLDRLRNVECVRPVREDEAARFGTLMHLALEAWWRTSSPADRLDAALAALAVEADPFDRARAEALIRGYDARWGGEQYEVLAVEQHFQTDLVNPDTGASSKTFRLAGKIDAVVRDSDGRVLIVEHKTSSEDIGPGSEYWRRLQIDGQVSTYYAGAQSLGYDVAGCLYDVIGKPALRPYEATPPEKRKYKADGSLYANQRDRAETPDEFLLRLCDALAADVNRYYQRGLVVRLESELAEFASDTWQTAQIIRDAVRTGRAPRNADACSRYGRTCAFFDVCTGAASIDDSSRFVKLNTPHPELAGAV